MQGPPQKQKRALVELSVVVVLMFGCLRKTMGNEKREGSWKESGVSFFFLIFFVNPFLCAFGSLFACTVFDKNIDPFPLFLHAIQGARSIA